MNDVAVLDGVEVDYRRRGRALGPVSLSVRAGEITAIVGASGCGKSTALRLLAGLEPPTRGRVSRALGPCDTSLVFQSATLMPWTSALKNVSLPLEILGAAEPRARAEAALARVGLSDALDAKPAQLSGGMAMRVSLARAMVTEPKLLLLDEPFAALDSVTRRHLMEDVHRLWAQTRPAVVFVTHDIDDAVYLASRVVVMSAAPGRIAAEIAVEGPLPRPEHFRLTPAFGETVERIGAALEQAMGANA